MAGKNSSAPFFFYKDRAVLFHNDVIITDAVDEQTGQDQVEDVEQWAALHFDDVRNVRIRLRAAAVVFLVMDGLEIHQVELAVRLVVAHVALVRLLLQIDLKFQIDAGKQ